MKELNLKEIRNYQLEILKEVATFCDNNNIVYYLCGGTLLGAIRHQGYIPWDDDIDLMMPRSDYENFLQIYESNKFKVYTFHNTKLYDKPFAKVSNLNTRVLEYSNTSLEIGINIDILPIDGFPSKSKDIQNQINRIKFYKNPLILKKLKSRKGRSFLKSAFLIVTKPFVKLLPTRFLLKKIEKTAMKYKFEESDNAGISVWGYGIKEVCPKSTFIGSCEVLFENSYFKAPKEYDRYLSTVYGDYMQLPPIEKQVSHHEFKAYENKI